METIKKPYEISLWEDILTYVARDDQGQLKEYTIEDLNSNKEKINIETQYYDERKMYILGSDTMTSPIRALQPKVNFNINGTITLTFSLYNNYFDEDLQDFCQNPFIKILANEKKIKLRYGKEWSSEKEENQLIPSDYEESLEDEKNGKEFSCKWYDLIIKNIEEDSENNLFTYTAQSLFINELSKTGFNIELNAELENNMGSINELAKTILEGSDWALGEEATIRQYTQEPLYRILLNQQIKSEDMITKEPITIPAGKEILGFYSIIMEQNPTFQFLYNDLGYPIDDNNVIVNTQNFIINSVKYDSEGKPLFAKSMGFESDYQGKRLVRKNKTKYDSTIDKYVQIYTDTNLDPSQEVCGYSKNEYISPAAVLNYITNSNGFENDTGWSVSGSNSTQGIVYPDLKIIGYPDIRDLPQIDINNFDKYETFLMYHPTAYNQYLVNSGINDYKSNVDNFVKGEEYIFRVKAKQDPAEANFFEGSINFCVREYLLENGIYKFNKENGDPTEIYFSGIINKAIPLESEDKNDDLHYGYRSIKLPCQTSISYSKLITKKIGIFISINQGEKCFFEDIQFFPFREQEIERTDGTIVKETCIPGGPISSIVKTRFLYYLPNPAYKSIDDVFFLYDGYEKPNNFIEQFEEKYEKIRSITASESNRFNLLQNLSETFECWIRFQILHDVRTGKILLDKNFYDQDTDKSGVYRQKKYVLFYESIMKPNASGFKYGINLKKIQRKIDSDGIVSKIIVKNNSNEFAKDGFCNIARAQSNPTKENFLLDFSYYIQQHLLDFGTLNNDLYLAALIKENDYADIKENSNGYLGYYKRLKRWNQKREAYIEELALLTKEIPKYEASKQTYTVSLENAQSQLIDQEVLLKKMTSYTLESLHANQHNEDVKYWWDNPEVQGIIASIGRLKKVISQHQKLKEYAETNLDQANAKKENIESELKKITKNKSFLNQLFYKKYSRFIQEGSWISEDYIDDELYFLDAKSTLHTSSQPKVSYDINVLELSSLPEYENYTFQLGDKTYIEDTDFFGYVTKDGLQTPYQEEIVVTEITVSLDSPEENQIKVQNYRTQFEDLFQRITATTQAIEFSTGAYNKVSNIMQNNGTIVPSVIQNSMANNSIRLENAKDQSVIWDETGITTISLGRPSEMLRIISGGLFISTDGGITWRTGITGSGINASCLTTGQINTDEINIMNGGFPSFRWDKVGLSAYKFKANEKTGAPEGFNSGKFVRFDQYGIYGIDGTENFDPNIAIQNGSNDVLLGVDKIAEYADFSLTWKGFKLKSKHSGEGDKGYISISSENDLEVFNGNGKKQIKIGALTANGANSTYGIQINDKNGFTVLQSDDDGKLFLTQYLRVGPNVLNSYVDRVKFGIIESYTYKQNEQGDIVFCPPDEKNKAKFSKILSVKGYKGITKKADSSLLDTDETIAIYDDGTLIASQLIANNLKGENVDISGRINATSGQIGNFTIGEVETVVKDSKKIEIQSEKGFSFKVNNAGIATPSELILMAIPIGFDFSGTYNLTWEGSSDYNEWESLNSFYKKETQSNANEIILPYTKIQGRQNYYIRLTYKKIVLDKTEELKAYSTITILSDGEKGDPGEPGEPGKQGMPGESIITVIIESSKGNIFINGVQDTILTARVFNGNTEITSQYEGTNSFTWIKQNQDGSNDENWNQKNQNNKTNKINIGNNDVDQRAKFTCILNE